MTHRDGAPKREHGSAETQAGAQGEAPAYQSPEVFDLGSVREVTQGNAKNGECDATTQYYR